jgi:hypothetical protein
MTTTDNLPTPADHPLLQHRAIWLLVGQSPGWLAAARQFIAAPRGPLMQWRASERQLQVTDAASLAAALLRLLEQQPIDFTLVCEPGLLAVASTALRQTLPNLMDPPASSALRVSEQRHPFVALLPRLQQPEPALAAAWLDWATARDTPEAGATAASADDWCALAAGTPVAQATTAPATAPDIAHRVTAAAQALADWSAAFALSFAPGELAQTFAGALADDADHDGPIDAQPAPLLQRFRPRPTDDGWMVLQPELPHSVEGHAAAMASASAAVTADGVWQLDGRFVGPSAGGASAELGTYALVLHGDDLAATLTLHLPALRRAPQPGQTLVLAVRAADGLALRLRGSAGAQPAGGAWTVQLTRQLSSQDAARLRAQPSGSVAAELWWAPDA